MIIGIDATNIRGGGTLTHLVEVLGILDPTSFGITGIVVWGESKILQRLPERDWLLKQSSMVMCFGIVGRSFWQRYLLSLSARRMGCDVLLVPGGAYAGKFQPTVTMSRNLLPFEMREMNRYWFSLTWLKLWLLRKVQTSAFRRSQGVIFLSKYAESRVIREIGSIDTKSTVIHHGVNPIFHNTPRAQHPIDSYSDKNPYRLIYVSRIEPYKHQWSVVAAIGSLRQKTGWPLVVDFIGPSHPGAMVRFQQAREFWDPEQKWSTYRGELTYSELPGVYKEADLAVFASTCETFGNVLMEKMAAGLPIVSSNVGTMRELLLDNALFFNAESPESIEKTLHLAINNPELRKTLAWGSYSLSSGYEWKHSCDSLFDFVTNIALESRGR